MTDLSTNAYARRRDPDTSLEAAESVRPSHLERTVLDALRTYDWGATTYMLAERLNMSLVTVSPRIKPLVMKGLVTKAGHSIKGASGRRQTVWIVTPAGRRA